MSVSSEHMGSDGQPSNHTFWQLSMHSISPRSATLPECQTKQMPRRS